MQRTFNTSIINSEIKTLRATDRTLAGNVRKLWINVKNKDLSQPILDITTIKALSGQILIDTSITLEAILSVAEIKVSKTSPVETLDKLKGLLSKEDLLGYQSNAIFSTSASAGFRQILNGDHSKENVLRLAISLALCKVKFGSSIRDKKFLDLFGSSDILTTDMCNPDVLKGQMIWVESSISNTKTFTERMVGSIQYDLEKNHDLSDEPEILDMLIESKVNMFI